MAKEEAYSDIIANFKKELENQERICEEQRRICEEHERERDNIRWSLTRIQKMMQMAHRHAPESEVAMHNDERAQDFAGLSTPQGICKLFAEDPERLWTKEEVAHNLSARGVKGRGEEGKLGISVGTAKTTLQTLYSQKKIRKEGRGLYGGFKSRI